MLNKTYQKNIWREIRSTKSRFISLFGIVLLGVSMLTGLMSVAPDMRAIGDGYFAAQNLCDVRVLSTLGLSEADVEAIAALEGVKAVMPVKSLDAEMQNQVGDTLVVKVQGMPGDPEGTAQTDINRLRLLEGRWPEATGECVVHWVGFVSGVALGDTLTFVQDESDTLSVQTLTVVGLVQDPMHFSVDGESSTAGDGSLSMIAFVPERLFTVDYYTTCYLTVEGAAQYSSYSEQYDALVAPVTQALEDLGQTQVVIRRQQLIGDAEAQLDEARAEYESEKADAEAQLAQAEAELNEAADALASAKATLQSGEAAYAQGQQELAAQKQALPDTLQQGAGQILVSQEAVLELEDRADEIRLAVGLIRASEPMLEYAAQALQAAEERLAGLDETDERYDDYVQALEAAQTLYNATSAQIAEYQAQLDEAKRQLYEQGFLTAPDVSNEELQSQLASILRRMKLALTEGQLTLTTGQAQAYAAFAQAEAELTAARTQLDAGWQEYESGLTQWEEGRAEYEQKKAEALAALADAEQLLVDAEEAVHDIAAGEWYVLDRDGITSFVTFEQNADRIADIARVFPVFFFLVAALVATTTMTRMVEENRQQMGTLKALGYSKADIAAKYLLYGLVASLLGSAAGILLGFAGFPTVIWYAYTIMYNIPGYRVIFYPGLIAAGVLISAAIIGVTTLLACRSSLREKSAALLLPKAPAAGKRILLERITPLWSRMKFSQKTTARNLFRYKKRFFMTVLGVAGCTALLLVGFGLQDSIMAIVEKQYTELNHSDLTITLTDEKALTVSNGLAQTLDSDSRVESWGVFYSRTLSLYTEDGQEASVGLLAAQSPADMERYFTFRTRLGHHPIPLEENSVILTEKTAENLGLSVGDSIWVENPAGQRVRLTLTGITENYLFSRLYLSSQQLEAVLGQAPQWNTVLAKTTCADSAAASALSETLLRQNYVSSTAFAEDTSSTFTNVISCINYVVLLVIACAAALAAVVLYNLINVNLAERKKELATIKVLGFYDKEVYRYIFREIELLSLIGSGVGLAIGVPLHQFIIRTVEIDQMMFIRAVAPRSYLFSVVLTMVFAVAMCFVMRRQVRAISMVESMKAPE